MTGRSHWKLGPTPTASVADVITNFRMFGKLGDLPAQFAAWINQLGAKDVLREVVLATFIALENTI